MAQDLHSVRSTIPAQERRRRLGEQSQENRAEGSPVSQSEEHKISQIERYPLREPVSGRRYCAIGVRTDDGLTGFGECESASARSLSRANEILRGLPATAFEVARGRLNAFPGLQAAINMALLDIVGRSVKAPVHQVLGGPTRFKARTMTALSDASNKDLADSMASLVQAGHRAFMVPPLAATAQNQGQAFVAGTLKRFELLRESGGDGVDFVLDGNRSLSAGDAASLAAAFERFHLLWFDEPCRLTNLATARKIAAETVTPLGFGRSVRTGGVFQDLLREQLVDVLRPSIARNGISQIRRIAALSETYYVAVAPYHNGGPIATAAALQLAASLPNFFIQQIPFPRADADRRMRAQIAGPQLENVREGYLALPTGPGLGISVNEDAFRAFRDSGA